jgi:hypothetical protein
MKSLFAAFALVTLVSSTAMAGTPEIVTRTNVNVLDKSIRVHAPGMTIPELRAMQAKLRAQAAQAPMAQTDSNKVVAVTQ